MSTQTSAIVQAIILSTSIHIGSVFQTGATKQTPPRVRTSTIQAIYLIDEERSNGLSLSEQDYQAYSPSCSNRFSLDKSLIDEECSHWLSLSGGDYQAHSASSEQWQPFLRLQDTSLSQNSPLYFPENDVVFTDSGYTSPTWDSNSSMLPEPSISDQNAFQTTEHHPELSFIGWPYSNPISGEIQNESAMQDPSPPLTPYSESSYDALVYKPQTPASLEPQDYYDKPLTWLADQRSSSYSFEVYDTCPESVPSITNSDKERFSFDTSTTIPVPVDDGQYHGGGDVGRPSASGRRESNDSGCSGISDKHAKALPDGHGNWYCSICCKYPKYKIFNNRSNCNRHVRGDHGLHGNPPQTYECPVCQKTIKRRDNLRNHITRHKIY